MRRSVVSFICLFLSILAYDQAATISEEIRRMITYPFSDPDPVAKPGKIYPYFRFDGYTTEPVRADWKMVRLENEWIRLWIAPEIGGKIYGAQEKSSGEYFIYHNNAVKFRDIAMRGAWTSGGIEINFGSIGHAPTTATPVDCFFRQNPDSSVSCFLGSYDLASRTEWRVEVLLYPDRAYFETRSSWVNPTVLNSSLYHWMNASADVGEDLKYYFPGTMYIDHSGNSYPWPVNSEGKDISIYRNNDYGNNHSYHVMGMYTDWFAGYYNRKQNGFGHWSRYPAKQGKKIWMWALSREGAIWKDLLADSLLGNHQYTEIQTGLLFNQAGSGSTFSPFKHMEFTPGSVQNFSEIWFPFNSTSGVNSISPYAVGNIIMVGDSVLLKLCPLVRRKDTLDIYTYGVFKKSVPISLVPLETKTIYAGESVIGLSAVLRGGELVLRSDVAEDIVLDRPSESFDFEWESVYGLYFMGVEYLRQREFSRSEIWLRRCIEKDRNFIPAYTSLAQIEFRKLNYDKARDLLDIVLSFDAYDPEANFLSGALYERVGDLKNARDAYGVALKYDKFRNAAICRLGIIGLRDENLNEGWDYLNYYLVYGNDHPEIGKLELVYLRKLRQDSLFLDRASRLLSTDPLNHFARFEKYLHSMRENDSEEFRKYITNEFPFQTYIELATWYMNAGLYWEADMALRLSPDHALVNYYRAFIADKLSETNMSRSYLENAIRADIDFVFPFRFESEQILKWAQDQIYHWKNQYYLSLIYLNRNRIEDARQLLDDVGAQPDEYFFYLTRGDLYTTIDSVAAERDYREALCKDKKQWRSYHKLVNYYNSLGFHSRALELSAQAYELDMNNYITAFDHAYTLLLSNKFYEAIDVLNKINILPHEGASQGREVWKKANLLASLDKYRLNEIEDARRFIDAAYSWPENLGVGRPYEVDERLTDFMNALILIREDKFDEAKSIYEKIVEETDDKRGGPNSLNILKVLSLRELNRNDDADQLFRSWIGNSTDNRLANWALAIYERDYELATRCSEERIDPVRTEPWEPSAPIDDLTLLNKIVLQHLREKR
ncbi:MAG TPA: DUF5107 domain-containing protein [Bacteroidales bacterium]|nr:DUF5107 domain-containing protein [Bacteroidales bacterium]